ncbi:MAG: DUF2474 domain-containing protein [Gammaproteobacteria bacterium]|nr:DUF2474 domain-containing protein [Gammaproteobacteria bacterium]
MSRPGGFPAPRGTRQWRRLAWFVALYLASLSIVSLVVFLLRRLM